MAKERPSLEQLSKFGNQVVREAGEKALDLYGKGKPSIKFDQGLVTRVELDLVDFLNAQLKTTYPEHQTYSSTLEMEKYTHDAKRYVWIFDPLDGAANFQAGIPIWGVSLTLLENFWPIFGVFFMPVTNDLFIAHAGQKGYMGGEVMEVSKQETLSDESLILTYSRFHNHHDCIFPGKIRNLGCTCAHICYVASGRAEAAVLGNESFKDLAASRVIIEAAGGKIYRLDGTEFFLNEYMDGRELTDTLVATSPRLVSQVRKAIIPRA